MEKVSVKICIGIDMMVVPIRSDRRGSFQIRTNRPVRRSSRGITRLSGGLMVGLSINITDRRCGVLIRVILRKRRLDGSGGQPPESPL
jgi:hypothetical protein